MTVQIKDNKSQNSVSVVETNKNTKLMDQIEVKAEMKKKVNGGFFSKKNLILIIIFFLISILIIGLCIKFFLQTNWKHLFDSIANGFTRPICYLWFALLIVTFIWNVFSGFAYNLVRFKQYGINVPIGQYILFSFTNSFLRTIIPWGVPESYSIFWLKQQNIPTHLSASITFASSFLWEVVQVVVTLPSAIIIFINAKTIVYQANGQPDSQGIAIMTLICVGFLVNFFSITFWIFFNLSKKLHYSMSFLFNKIKKGLHMKYHTKDEIAAKYKEKAVLKKDFVDFIKNGKIFFFSLLLFVLGELMSYFSLCWSMYFIQQVTRDGQTHIVTFNFWSVFNCVNVANTANRLNFLPNGAGIEWIIYFLVDKLGGWGPLPATVTNPRDWYDTVISNGLLIWRSVGILQAVIGMFTLIGLVGINVKQIKANSALKNVLLN